MANYTSKILGNAISGVRAQQAVIANIGNNIANVNTPGYSRRTVSLETRVQTGLLAGVSVGNGVDVSAIQRQVDTFIDRELRGAKSDSARSEIENSFLSRAQELFGLAEDDQTIGNALTGFFNAANDLSLNPASIELRSSFIQAGQTLVSTINTTYQGLANLQDEANNRLSTEVDTVNSVTSQIAELNGRISSLESGGAQANDERDRREILLGQLAEKLSFSSVETNDGSVTISLSNGFALVSGSTSRTLTVETSPSFAAGTLPQSLSGKTLSYIVYDYSAGAGTQEVDFTNFMKDQGGTIGGLLKVRGYVDPSLTGRSAFQADGELVEMASRIESITTNLLTSINQAYLGADRSSVTAGHQASSGDLNGVSPTAFGLFTFSGAADTNANGLPDEVPNYSSTGVGNYASRIQFAISLPENVAAALDLTPPPAAASFSDGDGRNMANLAALRTQTYTFSTGSVNVGTMTLDGAYQEAVNAISNKLTRSETDLSVSKSIETSAVNRRDEVSAVSLDEEFTQLITSQKAFEASARMIKTAQNLLDLLLNAL